MKVQVRTNNLNHKTRHIIFIGKNYLKHIRIDVNNTKLKKKHLDLEDHDFRYHMMDEHLP